MKNFLLIGGILVLLAPSVGAQQDRARPRVPSITVTGESPVVDALHAGVTSNFNRDWLQSVPTARQSYFDVVTYAPSVKINQVPNDSRFVIFGSSSDQN